MSLPSEDRRAITAERDMLRSDLRNAEWQLDRLRTRRVVRIGNALGAVRRQPRRLWRLPLDLVRAVRTTPATTKPTTSGGRDKPKKLTKQAEKARRRGDHYEAWNLLAEAADLQPTNPAIRARQRAQANRIGDRLAGRDVTRTLARLQGNQRHLRQLRASEGLVAELDPLWFPRLPGSVAGYEPESDARVLHFLKGSFPHRVAGATTRSRYTLLAQRAVGLDPVAVTELAFPRSEGVDHPETPELIDGIRHHRLDAGPALDLRIVPNDAELELWTLLADRVVRQERPAILHAASGSRGYENAVVALSLGQRYKLPVVYEVRSFHEATWSADDDLAEHAQLYWMRVERENECMRRADAVVTLGEAMKEELLRRGIAADKITVVPNAVDAGAFVPANADRRLRLELGLSGRPTVGYISNLSRREGVDILLRSVADLRDRGIDVDCLVCGAGPELEGLRTLSTELGINDRVRLPGNVPHEEVRRYYSLIDIFVVPRREDHASRSVTPIKPFEAMALERPMIVADLPALREIIDPPNRGLAFEPEKPEALADAIAALAHDAPRRAALGRSAREWVARERTWTANAESYVALYKDLLERRGGNAA